MPRADRSLRELTSYRLRRSSVAVMAEFNKIFAAYGLRRTTFSTLRLIVDNPGLRQGQLAQALSIERPNMVQFIDELERAGLVCRETDPEDRRAYALRATKAGRERAETVMDTIRAADRALIRDLTPEQIDAIHAALDLLAKTANSGDLSDVIKVPTA